MPNSIRNGVMSTVLIAIIGVIVGMGDHGKSAPSKPELPDGLKPWSFLIGEWELSTTRYSFEGEVIETETGTSTFSIAPGGRVIMESQHSVLNRQDLETLQLYAYNPRTNQIEIARTDSAHHAFMVTRGTITESRIDLLEKHPNPESDVTRRYSIVKTDPDHFVQELDFSLDQGKTWFTRYRAAYAKKY